MPHQSRPSPSPGLLRLRQFGNVVNLSTPAGLLVATLGRADISTGPGGLYLAEHYRLRFPVAGGFTIGNVLITAGRWEDLDRRCPGLLQHEEAHTWQYLYCLGLPYWLAYSACMGWSVLRTGDRGSGNFFERQAGLEAGGYLDRPARPVAAGARSLLAGAVRFRRRR